MAYGQALRQRVLDFYDSGQTTSQIAKRLSVSPAWCRRVKQFRGQAPRPYKGRAPKLDAHACKQLEEHLRSHADATLAELCDWSKTQLGISISAGAMWLTLRRLKLTLKKSR